MLFAEGSLQSTAYSCSHEIREYAPPETGKVMHNWDYWLNTGTSVFFQFHFCASLPSMFLCEYLLTEYRTKKKDLALYEPQDFIMMLYRWGCCPLQFSLAAFCMQNTSCMPPLRNWHPLSVQHVTLSLLIRVSLSACSFSESMFISMYHLVFFWIPPDVFWWSVMPWGQTLLLLIVWCRAPWLFMSRMIARCTEQLPCTKHQINIIIWSADVWPQETA